MTQPRKYEKPSDAVLRERLTPLAYQVTQKDGTEPPFRNAYWDNHEAGLYVDVVSGEPLFLSNDKFESGTGWPSFSRPVAKESVVSRVDRAHGMLRTEVRSAVASSHLGHVFEDGPKETGLRYCINSASIRFIPAAQLEAEGYGEYLERLSAGASPEPQPDNSCAVDDPDAAGCKTTLETVIFAGGCFWGLQELLRDIPGVLETEVGYTGGNTPNPVYDQVRAGRTGHAESVRVVFDPDTISFEDLLDNWFFKMHDPTTKHRQGNDRGSQYRSAIFYTTDDQRIAAQKVMYRLEASGKWADPLVTELEPASAFTRAEDYHQDYLQKHPNGYSCHFMRD